MEIKYRILKAEALNPVSYTHLDVYKRQILEPTQMTEPGISGKELLLKNSEAL